MDDLVKDGRGRPKKQPQDRKVAHIRVTLNEKPLVERFLKLVRQSDREINLDDLQCYCNK